MKKTLLAVVVALVALSCVPAFAQDGPKDAYYRNVQLTKVWLHPLGYAAQFLDSAGQAAVIYVPIKWFNKGALSKARIVYGRDSSYPYMTIIWVDGKFSHLTIYAPSNFDNPGWGELETVTDRSAAFNVEDVPRSF